MFLGKGVLKKWGKFTGEYPRRSVILIKLQRNVIEITSLYGCSAYFQIPFPKNTSEWMLLWEICSWAFNLFWCKICLSHASHLKDLSPLCKETCTCKCLRTSVGPHYSITQLIFFILVRLSYTLLLVLMQHSRFNLTADFREIIDV